MRKNPEYLNYGFKYDFTYSNFFHCWTSIMCIQKTYTDLTNMKQVNKNKLCSTITSGFSGGDGLYNKRIEFIKKLSKQKNFLGKIDIYGYNW